MRRSGECLKKMIVHWVSTSKSFLLDVDTQWLGTTVFRGTRKFEPSRGICPFPRNFYVFTEFCGIWYWTVIRGQIRHILVEFRLPCCIFTWFHHEIHDCHSGFDGKNTENIELSLSEIWPVNLVDRLYVSCSYRRQIVHIWSGSGGRRRLITIRGKFAAVSRIIWQTGPQNLEKFATENCGPYQCPPARTWLQHILEAHIAQFVKLRYFGHVVWCSGEFLEKNNYARVHWRSTSKRKTCQDMVTGHIGGNRNMPTGLAAMKDRTQRWLKGTGPFTVQPSNYRQRESFVLWTFWYIWQEIMHIASF